MSDVNLTNVLSNIKAYTNVIKTVVLGALIVGSTWFSSKIMKDSPKSEEQGYTQVSAMPTQPVLTPAILNSPVQASSNLQSVSFLVQSVGKNKSGKAFLNSLPDYRQAGNQVIVLEGPAAGLNLDSFKGRVVTATGHVSSYRGQSQLVVSDPTQIR